MKTATKNQRSGIVLIVVMLSIAVLSFLAARFAYQMKVETKLASNSNSEMQLLWLGRSGVEYARWILAQQVAIPNEPYDALNQVWAGGSGGAGTSNSVLSGVSLKDYQLGDGKFSITIVDLERKVNINIVDDVVLEQAFTLMGVEAGDAHPIVGAILDWIDPDDSPRLDGAESDYYQGLNPPYFSKNGPIDDLSELLLVRGITLDMYWGTTATNHPSGGFQNTFASTGLNNQPPSYTCGLRDIFTPLSTGRININTASAIVLQMVPGIDDTTANAIVTMRDDVPFNNVGELINVPGMTAQIVQSASKYCDVRSHTFEVTVDASVGNYTRQFIAVVGRNNAKDLQVLSFYWK